MTGSWPDRIECTGFGLADGDNHARLLLEQEPYANISATYKNQRELRQIQSHEIYL